MSRSLADFQSALDSFEGELIRDPIVASHLNALYDQMLEQNLLRIIEPFSRVQVSHVASLIKLPCHVVEKKLSQMILVREITESVCLSLPADTHTHPPFGAGQDDPRDPGSGARAGKRVGERANGGRSPGGRGGSPGHL